MWKSITNLRFSMLPLLLISFLFFFHGQSDADQDEWRCYGDIVQYRVGDEWKNSQDCGSINEQCREGPENCSGHYMTCCRAEKQEVKWRCFFGNVERLGASGDWELFDKCSSRERCYQGFSHICGDTERACCAAPQ